MNRSWRSISQIKATFSSFLLLGILFFGFQSNLFAQDEISEKTKKQIDLAVKKGDSRMLYLDTVSNFTTDTIQSWKDVQGGELILFIQNEQLVKIKVSYYNPALGTSFYFYLLDGNMLAHKLIYGYYNRPIGYDSIQMNLYQDNQVHDLSKSKVTVSKGYHKMDRQIMFIKDDGSVEYQNRTKSIAYNEYVRIKNHLATLK